MTKNDLIKKQENYTTMKNFYSLYTALDTEVLLKVFSKVYLELSKRGVSPFQAMSEQFVKNVGEDI